ncbi:MAG: hypothetical protein A2Z57_11145 [Planctomycetes bacterium RIFCSPHIGHO2_12_39_6]|nr:MAG: hypothetical protein A2Z57_11145 [Planctomycetes bacterium RIFCSPHIGHO2_12_39_6]
MKKNTNTLPKAVFSAGNITILKMAAHDVPSFKEIQGKEWVLYGKKNEYPLYLLDLYNRSSKHNAIVNGKAKYVFGQGFGKDGEEIVNSDNETLNEVTTKCILDCELFSGFYMEIIWERAGNKIAEIRHMDYSDMRSNKDNTEFYWSEKWTREHRDNPGEFIRNDNPDDVKTYKPYEENDKTGAQIFFYKAYRPGLKTYPLPEYQGAVVHIDIDIQIGDYWNNAIHNGFSASHIINFYNGIPTEKEQQRLEEKIGAKLTGARSKKYVLNFTDLKDKGSDVQKLEPEDLDRHLQILNETVQQEIFTGHHVTSPMLFGIKTSGQLGGRSELIEANELFQNIYVTPKQQLFEKLIGIVAKAKGIKGELKLGKIEPIGYIFSESIMVKYLPERAISEMVAQRMGVDLTKYPEHEQEREDKKEAENTKKFKKETEDRVILELRKRGKKRGGKVLKSRPVEWVYSKHKQTEEELITFAKDAITKDPSIVSISPPSATLPKRAEGKAPSIDVVYAYAWRDAIPVDERDTDDHPSREFCVEMMEMSEAGMTWTREDIDSLENEIGTSVWEMRGGWMTKGGTDIHLPYCRHIWTQQVIIN